jgi:Alanine-zipper, major outer membrane lipoprotein
LLAQNRVGVELNPDLKNEGVAKMSMKLRVMLVVLLFGLVGSIPAWAGSAVVGSVAGSLNASVGGQALLPNSVIFSGDRLQVKDGAAVVALDHGSRMAFGQDTQASLVRDVNGVGVVLEAGNVSIYHPAAGNAVRVMAGKVTVSPEQGYKSLGQVAMLNGFIVITAKQGELNVNNAGKTVKLAEGKTLTIAPKTAADPQTGASQKLAGGNTALEAGALGAGGVAAILAGVAMSRAGDAKTNAANATSAADSAASAASTADSDAVAATSAAMAAGSAANNSGCAIDYIFNPTGAPNASPYIPPAGYTCPPNPLVGQ